MRGLSILFILQGLVYLFQSTVNLSVGKIGKFASYNFSPIFYIIGIVLGLFFVLAGTGMWFRKRYSYYLSVFLCSLMSIYTFVAIVFMLNEKASGPLILVSIVLLLFLIIAGYILKSKSYFK